MTTAAPDPVLVHDYLLVMRGAERTFAAMAECWPQAPVSTLLYDAEGTWQRFGRHRISTSRLQKLGLTHRSELYFAMFQPANTVLWPGNVKRYRLGSGAPRRPTETSKAGKVRVAEHIWCRPPSPPRPLCAERCPRPKT